MDHFFGCVAMLMSRHLRLAVSHTLEDLVAFFEQYSEGSYYEGGAETPISTLGQPIIIRLVGGCLMAYKFVPIYYSKCIILKNDSSIVGLHRSSS